MKKIFILPFLCALFAADVNGQTPSIEKENLARRFRQEAISPEEYREAAREWNRIMEELGGYPSLPYQEQSGSLEFEYLSAYNLDKAIIFERILQWATINFTSSQAMPPYQNLETGKIILKGSLSVTHKKDIFSGPKMDKITEATENKTCYLTYIFTLNENRLRIQVINIDYEYTRPGYYSFDTYVPEQTTYYSIHSRYPITSTETRQWKANLDLLGQTSHQISLLVKELETYIANYASDYEF